MDVCLHGVELVYLIQLCPALPHTSSVCWKNLSAPKPRKKSASQRYALSYCIKKSVFILPSSTPNLICTVWVKKKSPPCGLVAIFPKRLGIFQPNFTCLLCVPIYARLRIFIQLIATLTKLCHIKHDHPVHIMCARRPLLAATHFLAFFPNN